MATAHKMEHFPKMPDSEPGQEAQGSNYETFRGKKGVEYKAKALPDENDGLLFEVKYSDKTIKLTPREWEVFKVKRGLKPEAKDEQQAQVVNILEVKAGDILEMSDGGYLKILTNDPEMQEVTFEHIEPDGRTDKKGKVKSRGYDLWRTYQDEDEVEEYLPAKTPVEEKPARRPDPPMSKDHTPEYEWATGKGRDLPKDISTRPEKARENPAEVAQRKREEADQKRYDEIMESLTKSAGDRPLTKKEVPLNLKQGQIIWNEQGDEIIVVDVVTNPENEEEGLMDGYAILGFPPKQGRNSGYVREKVPFSKLEQKKGKIFLTEQVPFIEIDKEAEAAPELMVLVAKAGADNSKPEDFTYKSVPMSELSRWNDGENYFAPGMEVGVKRTKTKEVEPGWKVVGSWFEETEVNRLLADYVSNRLRLAAKIAESHHKAKTAREEASKRYHQDKQSTAFADLMADLEGAEPPPLPQEPPPLPTTESFRSKFAEKTIKKKWWQWWK